MITLKTLPQATAQQIFDQVANHLLTQNKRAGEPIIDETTGLEIGVRCQYKDKNGLKCAAGCLIADNEYDPEFEERIWEQLTSKNLVPNNHSDLIGELQKLHDTHYIDPIDWKKELTSLAVIFELNDSVLNNY